MLRRDFVSGGLALGGALAMAPARGLALATGQQGRAEGRLAGEPASGAPPPTPAAPGNDAPASPAAGTVATWPAYLALERSGELARREQVLRALLADCRLCPRACGVDRLAGERGVCRAGARASLSSAQAHFGEEDPLVGRGGSGTLFFAHCNLRCCYCQNWAIAHEGQGHEVEPQALADAMLALQARGCHNLNLVTPSHVVPQIVTALRLAIRAGLRLPLVYNTSAYDGLAVLRLLDGVVDLYLPDLKYMDGAPAARYSAGARDYPEAAQAAIREMQRQVGPLVTDAAGVARRGLLLRHLVLPHNLAGSERFVAWVAKELGPETYVNIMAQYHPAYRAFEHPPLARPVAAAEVAQARAWARAAGLRRLAS